MPSVRPAEGETMQRAKERMNSLISSVSDEARQEIERLNQEIEGLQNEILSHEKEVRELMEREAQGEGIFAARVFELKQGKMRLITEIQHRKVHINHLLLDSGSREG